MSNRKYLKTGTRLTALFAISALLLAVAGCGDEAETASASGKDVRATVGQASRTTVPNVVTATGAIEAGTTVMVSTRMMGWVRDVHVTEGQQVAKGDLLVSIDDTDLRAKQAQAEAGIAEAKAVLANAEQMAKRFENLYADKSVSKQQLDDVLTGRDRARAGVRMAQAGLAEVKVHLSYLDIVSPVDGLVTRTAIEAGNMANPGMPLVYVETEGDMKVVAHLGEKDIASVAVGTLVDVDITSLADARFTVPVARINQAATPGSRTYDIEADLDASDPRLMSGMFARVTVPVGTREAVLVPAVAIHARGQLTGVWTVDDAGIAHLRWVRLGRPQGEHVEVLAGLDGGETVVLASEQPLAEGDRVVN